VIMNIKMSQKLLALGKLKFILHLFRMIIDIEIMLSGLCLSLRVG